VFFRTLIKKGELKRERRILGTVESLPREFVNKGGSYCGSNKVWKWISMGEPIQIAPTKGRNSHKGPYPKLKRAPSLDLNEVKFTRKGLARTNHFLKREE